MDFIGKFNSYFKRGDPSSTSKTLNKLGNDACHNGEGNPQNQSEVDNKNVVIINDFVWQVVTAADIEVPIQGNSDSEDSSFVEFCNADEDSDKILLLSDLDDEESLKDDKEFTTIKAKSDSSKVSKSNYSYNEVSDHAGKADGQSSTMLSSFERLSTNNTHNPLHSKSSYGASRRIRPPCQRCNSKHFDDSDQVSKAKDIRNWNILSDHAGKADGQPSAILSSFEKLSSNNAPNPFYLKSFYETSRSIKRPIKCSHSRHFDDSDSDSSIEVIKEGYRSSANETDEEDA